jgi:N-acyl-D-aspartate/D-glutamate deacylase
VEAYAQAVEAAKPSLNVGTLIGHTALRNNHMDDLFRPATRRKSPECAYSCATLRQGH